MTHKANGGIGVASRLGAQIVQVSRLKKKKKLKLKLVGLGGGGGHTKRTKTKKIYS